jgi:2-polyprenyl-6-methoxyphenol hydroxylase-like FAD-dependent oxidoreductase
MSSNTTRTQVLVVGAGPVGLLAALRLREQGVDVRIVDQQAEHAVHTFPVVLHPMSLRLLDSLGLTEVLFWRGRPVSHLAIYTEGERRAVLDLPKVAGISSGALTLPQDVLRKALTNALTNRGVFIEWNTRLASLQQDERAARGWLETQQSHDEAEAPRGSSFEADYVLGCDGYDSAVRAAVGIELVEHGALHSYAFFDALRSVSSSSSTAPCTATPSSMLRPLGQAAKHSLPSRRCHPTRSIRSKAGSLASAFS